ncbi:hypothetical protein BaRGS_00024182, partial [Batillaria attramentaria]
TKTPFNSYRLHCGANRKPPAQPLEKIRSYGDCIAHNTRFPPELTQPRTRDRGTTKPGARLISSVAEIRVELLVCLPPTPTDKTRQSRGSGKITGHKLHATMRSTVVDRLAVQSRQR